MNRSAPAQPAPFLPMSRREMRTLGWEALDVLLVTGDAYVDHPAFGAAIIGRALEAAGFRVGIVAQPDWKRPDDFTAMGAPRLFAGVTAGAMDSMVANFTANKKKRRDDAYTPGGLPGRRPNYATIVYANMIRSAFPGVPVVIGGIEASLRRFAHYDYWKNAIRRSVLLDSKADLLVVGMGEATVVEIAKRLRDNEHSHAIPGTVEALAARHVGSDLLGRSIVLPTYDDLGASPKALLAATLQTEKALARDFRNGDAEGASGKNAEAKPLRPHPILQLHGDRYIVEWPRGPMQAKELDAVYALPFQRRAHPTYKETVPALEPVAFSVVSHRGCFGGCSFCALALHQGKRIVSRTPGSVLAEIEHLTTHPDFRGTITDVGGPTANMYGMGGRDEEQCARCERPSCLHPAVCPNLDVSPRRHLSLLRRARRIPGVKHLFIASGVRYDLLVDAVSAQDTQKPPKGSPEALLEGEREAYLKFLVAHLVGGHLSVAPEHVAPGVLRLMRKPPIQIYDAFARLFAERSKAVGKEQYLMPYFIASFPGSTDEDMQALMRYLKNSGRRLQQVQDFLPSPMTLATAMYHAECDWGEKQPLYVAKTSAQRRIQRQLLLYHKQENKPKRPERKRRPERRRR